MNTKHTPGPWQVPPALNRPDWEPLKNGGGVLIGEYMLDGMKCDDAHLIAAAPELLEALLEVTAGYVKHEGFNYWHRLHGPTDAALNKARAAIAKATNTTK